MNSLRDKYYSVLLERKFSGDCMSVCDQFIDFCCDHLSVERNGLKVRFLETKTDKITTAAYLVTDKEIHVLVEDRALVDVLRSIAHEMVHYKQHINNELTNSSGATGSEHENEANAVAGVIMRNFQDSHAEEIY